jgi:hypothetical protein
VFGAGFKTIGTVLHGGFGPGGVCEGNAAEKYVLWREILPLPAGIVPSIKDKWRCQNDDSY